MKNVAILALVFPLFFASCIEQKYIFKKNTVTVVPVKETVANPNQIPIDSLFVYKISRGFISKIETKGDYIVIEKAPKKMKLTSAKELKQPPSTRDFKGKYYYIEPDTALKKVRKFTYFDTKPVLQGISIPLKIRPKLTNPVLLDSFPSQAETGFNIALAGGWKFNINSYSSKKDVFGKNLRQFSLTPGWLLGTGAVDLTKDNTRNPVIEFKRRAAILSTGGFIMLGYNNINFGYSFGWDFATGEGNKGWLYQGQLWHGVTIGFDIIK